MTKSTELYKVLHTDKDCRKENISGDLFKLDELNTKTTWDFSLPTLVTKENVLKQGSYQVDLKVFKEELDNLIYPLSLVDMKNLCIAGGCIKSLILKETVNDIDIFLYGIKTVEKANKRIDKFITDLYKALDDIKTGKLVNLELNKLEELKKE